MSETKTPVAPVAVRLNDAAKMIGIGRSSLYELINENKLQTVRIAGRRLVPVSAIHELIDKAAA
jgi:excisionase family DNA binding protein